MNLLKDDAGYEYNTSFKRKYQYKCVYCDSKWGDAPLRNVYSTCARCASKIKDDMKREQMRDRKLL